MSEDDERMIRIQSGETAAFEELVESHQSSLIGFFYRNTRDAQMSEDLAQETLLRVFNQSWDYLPMGKFRGWMFRIARNLLIDSIRRQSSDALIRAVKGKFEDESDLLARVAGEVLAPEEHASQNELTALVNVQLEQLPYEQRMTFTLHHFGALSLPEVADAMETSVPTTKSRLRLAREKLRAALKRSGVGEMTGSKANQN